MPDPRRRISSATAFFALLALALAIALYLEKRPFAPSRDAPSAPTPTARPVIAKKARAVPRLPTPRRGKSPPALSGRIAIVIDDLGNDAGALARIASWPWPVAGSVLPGLPGSADAARQLSRSGKEVLLHLPMEPDGYPQVRPGPGVVLRSDTDEQIAKTVIEDLEWVPGAVGVNNHMGSAATADPRVMRAVVRVLAQRGLFLLDSRTTEASVARRVADEAALPAASRRIFLDSVISRDAVERSFRQLLRRAKTDGTAIAIGHPHPETLALLEEELPRLPEEGVKLVPVSALALRGPRR